jgi:hypothetical protein
LITEPDVPVPDDDWAVVPLLLVELLLEQAARAVTATAMKASGTQDLRLGFMSSLSWLEIKTVGFPAAIVVPDSIMAGNRCGDDRPGEVCTEPDTSGGVTSIIS